MTMRFKIGFTITAETLFGLLAKFLPVENLSVEEIMPSETKASLIKQAQRLSKKLAHDPREQRMLDEVDRIQAENVDRPRRPAKRAKAPRRGLNLTDGVNSVIMALLADGQPHRPGELKPLLEAKSYSPNGLGSRLERLKAHGFVFQPKIGYWQLAKKPE